MVKISSYLPEIAALNIDKLFQYLLHLCTGPSCQTAFKNNVLTKAIVLLTPCLKVLKLVLQSPHNGAINS